MIKCKLINVDDIRERFGNDWSELNIKVLAFNENVTVDLRDIILPNDKYFFKRIRRNGYKKLLLPKFDINNYIFDEIDISKMVFHEDTVLPKDYKFFQKIKARNLDRCILPKGSYEKYDFEGVSAIKTDFGLAKSLPKDFFYTLTDRYNNSIASPILPSLDYSDFYFYNAKLEGVEFGENSILPKNPNFFDELRKYSYVNFPKGDYRKYNFNKFSIFGSTFTKDSYLPEDKDFIKSQYYMYFKNPTSYSFITKDMFILTQNMLNNIQNYDLNGVRIFLSDYEEEFTEQQLSLLRILYKDVIGDTLYLPKKAKIDKKEIKENIEITL